MDTSHLNFIDVHYSNVLSIHHVDVVAWNLHRRYGEFRLPKLLEGWEVVGRYGWDEEKVSAPRHFTRSYEPILVLSPTINSSDGDSRSSSSSNRNKEEL